MKTLSATGALLGSMNPLRRWVAQAMASHPLVLVVPGVDVARAQGVDVPLPLASNPREASILLIVAPLTEAIIEKAAVAFAQMPRPRAILSVGVDSVAPLPPADVSISDPASLADGLAEIQHLLATQAWSTTAIPYERAALMPESEEEPAHHHDHGSHSEHEPKEEEHPHHAEQEESHQHEHPKQEEEDNVHHQKGHHEHNHTEHQPYQEASHEHDSYGHDAQPEYDHEAHHQHDEHPGHDHGGHDHGGGMMSMEMMTQDLPRSEDGLPMDWNEAHFGPFFPGLPGGLALHTQLDGDTVAGIHWVKGLTQRHLAHHLPGKLADFADRLAAVSVFSPDTYRILAEQTVEQISGTNPSDEQRAQRVYQMERERVLNHLNGLARLGVVIGNPRAEQQARHLFFTFRQHPRDQAVQDRVKRLVNRVRKLPFLRQKLRGIGSIPSALLHHTRGPVRRAGGEAHDLRSDDPVYQSLSFRMMQEDSQDSWGRLLVRLHEIEESLRLTTPTSVRRC